MKMYSDEQLAKGPWSCLLFPHLVSAGHLDAATACFASEGCLFTPDATGIHGRESIRVVLTQLIALRPDIKVESRSVVVAGDVAFSRERWIIRTRGARSSHLEQPTAPTLVMRWTENRWKVMIAAPWDRRK